MNALEDRLAPSKSGRNEGFLGATEPAERVNRFGCVHVIKLDMRVKNGQGKDGREKARVKPVN